MSVQHQDRYRAAVRRIWDALQRLAAAREFDNLEGGSVEQQRDQRLQLQHCANYAAVIDLLPQERPGLRLLELGCGSGALAYALAQAMPDSWSLVATDYSESLVRSAGKRYRAGNLRFEQLDVLAVPPGRLADVDVVFLLEVFEHLRPEDEVLLLGRLYQAMKPGARLILSTPDRAPFPRPFSGYAPHFVEYTHGSLSHFLADAGRNPFEQSALHRITSRRIAAEVVRAENRGGYIVNRLHRALLSAGRRVPVLNRMREVATAGLFRLYSRLPRRGEFDFESYLATLELGRDDQSLRDADSFSLVAELRKT